LSPTFAAAKGIGPWDIQSTIGANLPASGTNLLGRAIVFNTAVDYRIKGKIWPMLEQNSIFWSGGTLDGKKEVFLTPGLVLGGFPLAVRLHLSVGGGVQIAATSFHQYSRSPWPPCLPQAEVHVRSVLDSEGAMETPSGMLSACRPPDGAHKAR